MASLEEAEVELLREKIGGAAKASRPVVERRLEGKAGTTVVRRRRKKQPEPEPEPTPVAAEEAPAVAEEPAPDQIVAPEAEEPEGEAVAAEEAVAVAEDALPEPIAAAEQPVV